MSDSVSHNEMAMAWLFVSSIAVTVPAFPGADEMAGATVSLNNLAASSYLPGSI